MKSEYLSITGMTSDACASAVTQALSSLMGVGQVKVSLADGEATVHFNERLTSPARIRGAVEEAGYGVDHSGPVHTRRVSVGTALAAHTSSRR